LEYETLVSKFRTMLISRGCISIVESFVVKFFVIAIPLSSKVQDRKLHLPSRTLVDKLGCAIIEFPGHHDIWFWMPEEFANAIWRTLEQHGYDKRNNI
jgi:hypothetical protein